MKFNLPKEIELIANFYGKNKDEKEGLKIAIETLIKKVKEHEKLDQHNDGNRTA